MRKALEDKVQLLERNVSLLETKSKLHEETFALSSAQDSRPSGILRNLGNNIEKKAFPAYVHNSDEAKKATLLNSLAKIFVSPPYTAIGQIENNIYIALSASASNRISNIAAIIDSTLSLLEGRGHVPQFYKTLYEQGNDYVIEIIESKERAFTKNKKEALKNKRNQMKKRKL